MCSIKDLAGCSDSMAIDVTTTQDICSVFTPSAKTIFQSHQSKYNLTVSSWTKIQTNRPE